MTGGGRGGKPKAGFPPRPPPLEIAKGALPTFPLSLPDKLVQTQKTRKRTGCGGKVEIQNRDSHFSTAPNACGARKGIPTLLAGGIGHTRITHQKGGPAAVASLPPSGSFFNENMLTQLVRPLLTMVACALLAVGQSATAERQKAADYPVSVSAG